MSATAAGTVVMRGEVDALAGAPAGGAGASRAGGPGLVGPAVALGDPEAAVEGGDAEALQDQAEGADPAGDGGQVGRGQGLVEREDPGELVDAVTARVEGEGLDVGGGDGQVEQR